eukprot:CAMPEP_0180117600 /NCGR_PEP_ID=MMETSP0986-20121125/1004_1 /TAXON_ID=697907 /ORGANISM="non described non described, Strain CCMP2293" /LENGTH=78 /DNA_ID=CAMNT_0022056483 /DNA_START=279 /DNA_END=513 /DNA_ORIENTATION=+
MGPLEVGANVVVRMIRQRVQRTPLVIVVLRDAQAPREVHQLIPHPPSLPQRAVKLDGGSATHDVLYAFGSSCFLADAP